jgi:hypothetical protein
MGCGRNSSDDAHHHQQEGCVCEVVKTILKLQNQAVRNDCDNCGTSCFLEPLGGIVSPTRSHADTRVFMLFNKNGTIFNALFKEMNRNNKHSHGGDGNKGGDGKGGSHGKNENNFGLSPFFRVEDVFGDCCATLRVIAPVDEDGKVIEVIDEDGMFDLDKFKKVEDFEKTDNCLTVDLNFFVGIQCIADVDLDICK